ncbi:hypothetical protein BUALT_Bualt10G0083700 [Buddleja alternifolia]|uniref:GH10 domain-containing protein n=1 Tax=Buddleja alternifolia TaxID=168488 RepID=A0AAV6X499_9LAMI|nr:hypothetical protein BUALT_Bualt10G0083700 [Buddleja alternifolia]
MMMRMSKIKAIAGIIKRKLRVYCSESSTTMKRITRIKEIVDKLMEELKHEALDVDIQDEMETLIQELQCRLSEREAALKDQRRFSEGLRDIMEGPSTSHASLRFLPGRIPDDSNIIDNHDFSGGLHSANSDSCEGFVVSPEVAISGGSSSVARVQACLSRELQDSTKIGIPIGRTSAATDHWETLEGTFSLSHMPYRVTLYLEGPPPGVDLLIKSVMVSYIHSTGSLCHDIIRNPEFENGLKHWSGRGCTMVLYNSSWSGRGCKLVLHDSMGDGRVLPKSGNFFVSTENRTRDCNGIEHEITGRVDRKLAYDVVATVRVFGNNITSEDVRAKLWVQRADLHEQYIEIASVQATDKDWVQLQGKFLLNGYASRVIIYLEGPPPGTDILLDNLVVKRAAKVPRASRPIIEKALFGVNIITNSNLSDGTNEWTPFWQCNLSVKTGSPYILPPLAEDLLGSQPLSGRYILVTKRMQRWEGPCQIITDKVKPYVTYQVSAWVRIDTRAPTPQIVNVVIKVDHQWVSGGKVEINDDQWNEIGGSFRIETQPAKIIVLVQGPAAGVDLMVSGLQIFPVDRRARFRHLRKQTDRIRKRDVTLKFTRSNASTLGGTLVKIRQTQNSFPFGSCINRSSIDNEDFVNFFSKNFNWAVFPEELKWSRIELEQKNLDYRFKDVDEMMDLCTRHNIQLRGVCIVQSQSRTRALSRNDLRVSVHENIVALLSSYKGKFNHYAVNNDIMNGSFNQDQDHLERDFLVDMFKIANASDPFATLFLKDYHVEDGFHLDKYTDHIRDLKKQGALIGGIGIQGHMNSPIGPIVCSALDKLARLGIPMWFTELDVSSDNEYVRADDIEVMLREAFAHHAVKGVMLWGFWELLMNRGNAHLVNAEGDLNEAGKRYLALKKEWLTHAQGHLDEEGRFEFRGFHGSYEVEVSSSGKKVDKTFVVDEGEDPITITVDL